MAPELAKKRTATIFPEDSEDTSGTAETFQATKKRVYYLDWMRVIAIYLVICFHVVQALDELVGLWPGGGRPYTHDAGPPTMERILVENYQSTALMVGMPLFFQISGRAQAQGRFTNLGKILVSRCMRLLVPFLVCYAVLIPPWLFIDYPDPHMNNLFEFELFYWTQGFTFNAAWLWFLPVLFVITVTSAALLLFSEHKRLEHLFMAMAVWVLSITGLVASGRFNIKFALLCIAGQVAGAVLCVLVPFLEKGAENPDLGSAKQQWLAIRVFTVVQVASSIGMVCNFKYTDLPDAAKSIPAFLLFNNFYIHGYFAERWAQGCEALFVADHKGAPAGVSLEGYEKLESQDAMELQQVRTQVRIYQVFAALAIITAMTLSAPVGHREIMLYPIYSASYPSDDHPDSSFAAMHVLGTWAYLGVCMALGQAYLNHEINPWFYQHASSSTTVVYIFHWMFLKFFSCLVIRDLGLFGNFFFKMFDVIFLFAVSVFGSIMIYCGLLKSPLLGSLFGL